MLSEEVRARLARLHAARRVAAESTSAPVLIPRESVSGALRPAPTVENLLARGEECENASGRHLRFRRPITQCWPQAERAIGRLTAAETWARGNLHPELAAAARWFPQGTLFLDLETCGFAGSMVFLVGLVWHADGELAVDQLFARNYAEERAVLETLWQIAARNRVLVTFNGKSFDWPMVHDRSTRHHLGRDQRGTRGGREQLTAAPKRESVDRLKILDRLEKHDPRPELVHCDLLHHARRRWKGLLPNCKLQTLERYVCRRYRTSDLAGALVPAAYHDFVRTGETRHLDEILHHNALDLVTLAQLTCGMLAARERPALGPRRESA